QFFVIEHRDGHYGAITTAFDRGNDIRVAVEIAPQPRYIGDMSDLLGPRYSPKSAIGRRMNDRGAYRRVGRWRVVHGHGPETVARAEVERSEFGLADAHRVPQHGLEHSVQLTRRAADDLQDLRGCSLLLQRFGQLARARLHLVEQPHVLDRD